MPTAISLTPIRRLFSDCLGTYPTITKILRQMWEDGEMSTEQVREILTFLNEMPSRITVCGGQGPGPIERALRNRHATPAAEVPNTDAIDF